MDGTRSHCVKGNMPDSERQILYFFSYIWKKPRLQIYIMCMCMCDETIKRSMRGRGELKGSRKRRWWAVDNKKAEENYLRGGREHHASASQGLYTSHHS